MQFHKFPEKNSSKQAIIWASFKQALRSQTQRTSTPAGLPMGPLNYGCPRKGPFPCGPHSQPFARDIRCPDPNIIEFFNSKCFSFLATVRIRKAEQQNMERIRIV